MTAATTGKYSVPAVASGKPKLGRKRTALSLMDENVTLPKEKDLLRALTPPRDDGRAVATAKATGARISNFRILNLKRICGEGSKPPHLVIDGSNITI